MTILRRAWSVALVRRSALFDITLDYRATADAALLVAGVNGVGHLWSVLWGGGFSLRVLLFGIINALMIWVLLAGLTFLLGRWICQSETSMSTVMRLQGFCHLPLLIAIFFPAVALIGWVWFFTVLVFATAEALDTVYWRAALTVAGRVVGLIIISQLLWGGRLF